MSTTVPNLDALLKPLRIGSITIKNRFIMAPMVRQRADTENVPTDDVVKYYADRASMGLIITEASIIRKGYPVSIFNTGIYGPEQIAGWKRVTDAVHAKGGLIYCQIIHAGRAAVEVNVDKGVKIVAPSDLAIVHHSCPGRSSANGEKQPYPVPHAMTKEEIAEHVQLYATAARNAMEAGFDGVQIHGANGYLIDQFLKTSSNQRTDEYGGSMANRCRFLFEVVDAVIAAIGHDRTALRISPLNSFNDQADENPEALTKYICSELNSKNLAFLDVTRGDSFTGATGADKWARAVYKNVMFAGMGYEVAEAAEAVAKGYADAIVFGRTVLANPDLVERAIAGAELNTPDMATFYVGGNRGYNDYPTLAGMKDGGHV